MRSESLTENIRRRASEQAGRCSTCGQPTVDGGVRALAEDIGIPHTVLWRFLRGGDMTGRNLDKVNAWLESQPLRIEQAL